MATGYVGYHYQLRVILIGDSTVGKTSLVQQLLQSSMRNLEPSLTVGVDYYSKVLQKGDLIIKVQMWDTAGQERFRSIVRSYYKNAVGGLLVFDISNRKTFENIDDWLEEAKAAHETDEYVYILVGNKSDKSNNREVTVQEARQYAQSKNMKYIETSAKTGANVDRAFDSLVDEIMRLIQECKIRLNRVSWDGVKQGQVLTQSMLSSTITNTGIFLEDENVPLPSDSMAENTEVVLSKSYKPKKCSC